MEDRIKYLAADLIAKLDQLQQEADFDFLATIRDDEIRGDAQKIHEEINRLKAKLQEL